MQYTSNGFPVELLALTIFSWTITAIVLVGIWKTFRKAGYPGWGILVPLYNFYIMIKMAGYSGWGVLLIFLPFISIIFYFMVAIRIAKAFGRSTLFGATMLTFLGPIGFCILGYGKSQYKKDLLS